MTTDDPVERVARALELARRYAAEHLDEAAVLTCIRAEGSLAAIAAMPRVPTFADGVEAAAKFVASVRPNDLDLINAIRSRAVQPSQSGETRGCPAGECDHVCAALPKDELAGWAPTTAVLSAEEVLTTVLRRYGLGNANYVAKDLLKSLDGERLRVVAVESTTPVWFCTKHGYDFDRSCVYCERFIAGCQAGLPRYVIELVKKWRRAFANDHKTSSLHDWNERMKKVVAAETDHFLSGMPPIPFADDTAARKPGTSEGG